MVAVEAEAGQLEPDLLPGHPDARAGRGIPRRIPRVSAKQRLQAATERRDEGQDLIRSRACRVGRESVRKTFGEFESRSTVPRGKNIRHPATTRTRKQPKLPVARLALNDSQQPG